MNIHGCRLWRKHKKGRFCTSMSREMYKACLQCLFYSDEIIVLLALLYEQVLTVDEVVACDDLVEGGEFLLVEAHAVAFGHLAHLTF